MSMNETYQPINCDDYDNLELACQHHLLLTLALKDGEVLQAKANDLVSRKTWSIWSQMSQVKPGSFVSTKLPASATRRSVPWWSANLNFFRLIRPTFHVKRRLISAAPSGMPYQTYTFFTFCRPLTRHENTRSRNQRFAVKQQRCGISSPGRDPLLLPDFL